MLEDFDQSELLAYAEGELKAEEARSLGERLAADPGAKALVEGLRKDRRAMGLLPEPEPPMDFLAALEPQLARPLLTGYRPGEYRRRHRRRSSMVRTVRMAAAAVIVVAAGVGVWLVLNAVQSGAPIAAGPAEAGGVEGDSTAGGMAAFAARQEPATEGARSPADLVIHHYGPMPPRSDASMTPSRASGAGGAGSADHPPLTATFALVLHADQVSEAEHAMVEILQRLAPAEAEHSPPVALVRNFTYEEARMLVARIERERYRDQEKPLGVIGLEGEDISGIRPEERARLVRETARRLGDLTAGRSEEDEPLVGRRLLGVKECAASYKSQLDLSNRGAMHTITVPASGLTALCEAFHSVPEFCSALRPLLSVDRVQASREGGEGSGTAAVPPGDWVESMRQVRVFLAELHARHDQETPVLLPVVVNPSPRVNER